MSRADGSSVTREVETGTADREGNMIEFAVAALGLVRDVLKEAGAQGEGKGAL